MAKAMIWGASSGIGQALVRHLKAQDWQVFAVARQTERIPDEADFTYTFDAGQEHSVQEAIFFTAQETQELDLVVYFAGDLAYEKLADMTSDQWHQTLNSNLNGAFYTAHHGLPLLRQGGHMIFVGAYIEHIELPKMGAYAVAKAGLAELVTILQKENRRQNFTLIRPGAVDTDFWNQVSFKKPADAKSPEVIAEAILGRYNGDSKGDLNL